MVLFCYSLIYLSDLPLDTQLNKTSPVWLHSASNNKHDISFDVEEFHQSTYKDVYPDK